MDINQNYSTRYIYFIRKWEIVISMKKRLLTMHFSQPYCNYLNTIKNLFSYRNKIWNCRKMLKDIQNTFCAFRINGMMILNIKVEIVIIKRKNYFHLLELVD